jgi:eukaryotic-like serine/threonine-protein kinase
MSTKAVVADGAPAPGAIIGGKYRVVGALGQGGMGCLVEAEHLLLKKPVAIKFVLAERSAATRGRLFREARATQALSSDHVVRVFDLGMHEEAPYIVMELLEGTDLAALVDTRGPLGVEAAVDCILEASVAVAQAHAAGIIHRDIKPANLFATRTRTQELVKVLDFGISKVPERADDEDCEKTAEDAVLGTPYYASPEQLRNPAKIDARADVWALGVTLFYLLTGEHPFVGESAREVTAAIFTDPPRDLGALRSGLPDGLGEVIAAALVKRPEERVASVAALVQLLLPFASKRGRIAGERVAAMAPPEPLPAAPAKARDAPLSTTDAGLSSTVRTGVDAALSAAPSPPLRPRVSWMVALSAAVLAGLVAVVWLLGDPAPNAVPQPVAPAASPPPSPEAAAPPLADESTAMPAEVPATEDQAIATPAPRPAKPHKATPPAPSASAPPATSSTGAPPPTPRHDIDGVPIVE